MKDYFHFVDDSFPNPRKVFPSVVLVCLHFSFVKFQSVYCKCGEFNSALWNEKLVDQNACWTSFKSKNGSLIYLELSSRENLLKMLSLSFLSCSNHSTQIGQMTNSQNLAIGEVFPKFSKPTWTGFRYIGSQPESRIRWKMQSAKHSECRISKISRRCNENVYWEWQSKYFCPQNDYGLSGYWDQDRIPVPRILIALLGKRKWDWNLNV